MNTLIQRIQSYFASSSHAHEKIDELLIELRHRGLNFNIQKIKENGQEYLYAETVDYPRGHISATGKDIAELEQELKDAIFTAFEVPAHYCNPNVIVFNPPLTQNQTAAARQIHATT